MANKTVYVKDADLPLWDEFQAEVGESVSALLVDCMRARLIASQPIHLTKNERIILLNQFRILAVLAPGEREYKVIDEALRYGYVTEYETLLGGDLLAEMQPSSTREVMDTLDLYRMLRNARRDLGLNDIAERDVTFLGYDGNEEIDQYTYTRFLIDGKGLWGEYKGSDLNNPGDNLPKYRRMIAKWKQCAEKWHPTETEVRGIIASAKG